MQFITLYLFWRVLGYTAVHSVESQSTFRRNMSPPSSGEKNQPSKKPEWSKCQASSLCYLLHSKCKWMIWWNCIDVCELGFYNVRGFFENMRYCSGLQNFSINSSISNKIKEFKLSNVHTLCILYSPPPPSLRILEYMKFRGYEWFVNSSNEHGQISCSDGCRVERYTEIHFSKQWVHCLIYMYINYTCIHTNVTNIYFFLLQLKRNTTCII